MQQSMFAKKNSLYLIILKGHHRWGNIENRRNFFENYAKRNGLDPQKPESWYSLSRKKLASLKVTKKKKKKKKNQVLI
jgi:hypothetical protein